MPGVPEATTTTGHVLLGSPIPSSQGLSHAVGGKWTTPANDTSTLRFEWPTNSDLAEDVVGSDGIEFMIRRLLLNQKAALAAAATTTESVVTLNTLLDDGINFADSDRRDQVHVAIGACKFEGGMQVKVKKGTGASLIVSEVNCWGALIDLYDWSYDAKAIALPVTGQVVGEPREASKVQAGYATLAASTSWPDAGRVFFTKINFGTGWIDFEETIP